MKKVINLKNGLKFVVLCELELDSEMYLYLSSMDEDINFVFAKVINSSNIQLISDEQIIAQLMNLVDKKIKENYLNNKFDS